MLSGIKALDIKAKALDSCIVGLKIRAATLVAALMYSIEDFSDTYKLIRFAVHSSFTGVEAEATESYCTLGIWFQGGAS